MTERAFDLDRLPANLPVPVDDGACDHLPGLAVPPVLLPSTAGRSVDLSKLEERTVASRRPASSTWRSSFACKGSFRP